MIFDKIKWNPKQLLGLKILSDAAKKFILFWGGSRSGKTFMTIRAIRIRCHIYPGSKHLVARYSFANAHKTIWLQTMLPEFRKDEKLGLCKILSQPGIIIYKNGSMVILGGLEPSKIDSVLGAEYGTIFVTEANENKFEVIENLFSRLTDTSKDKFGNRIKLKFIFDLNPTVKTNWTNQLFLLGIDPMTGETKGNFHEYANLHFRPEDNEENLSEGYIEILKNMSPAKRKRYYEGQYGHYDGLVYQLDPVRHIIDDFPIPAHWPKIRVVDFGYIHPFACLWQAYSPEEECMYIYRDYSVSRRTVADHAIEIKALSVLDLPKDQQTDPEAWKLAEKLYQGPIICDWDREDRATLEQAGFLTTQAAKEVEAGIDNVIELLDHNEKSKPRIKIFRSCSATIFSCETYRWKDAAMSGRAGSKDREVVKENDDEADCIRYGAMHFFPVSKGFEFVKIGGDGVIGSERRIEQTLSEVGEIFRSMKR